MRISDWSSDVCSSDLDPVADRGHGERRGARAARGGGAHGLHQLSDDLDRHDDDLLRLWPRPVRQRRPRSALSLLLRHVGGDAAVVEARSEEHTSELQSLMSISYAVFCLKKTNIITIT